MISAILCNASDAGTVVENLVDLLTRSWNMGSDEPAEVSSAVDPKNKSPRGLHKSGGSLSNEKLSKEN